MHRALHDPTCTCHVNDNYSIKTDMILLIPKGVYSLYMFNLHWMICNCLISESFIAKFSVREMPEIRLPSRVTT